MDKANPPDRWARIGVRPQTPPDADAPPESEGANSYAVRPSVSLQRAASDKRGTMDQEAAKPRARPWAVLTSRDIKTWGGEDPKLRPLFRRLVEDALGKDSQAGDPQALSHLLKILLPIVEANAAKVHQRHADWYGRSEVRNEYFALLVVGLPLGMYSPRERKAAHNDPPPTPGLAYWLADGVRSFSDFVWIVLSRRTITFNQRLGRHADREPRYPDDLQARYAEPHGASHNWSPEDLARSADAALSIAKCLETLSERDRSMLRDVCEDDRPQQDIAAAYGISPSTLSNILGKFRAKVDAVLDLSPIQGSEPPK